MTMIICPDIPGPLRINLKDFGDLLTFPPAGPRFHFINLSQSFLHIGMQRFGRYTKKNKNFYF